ncbi:unnamed protein product [Sphacelaria rigidula]
MTGEPRLLQLWVCILAFLVHICARGVSAWLHLGGLSRSTSFATWRSHGQVSDMDMAAATAAAPLIKHVHFGRRLRRRHSIATLASSDGEGGENGAGSSNEEAGGSGPQTEGAVPMLYIKGLKKSNDVVRQEDVEKVVRSARTARGEGGAEEETEQILDEEQEGFDWERLTKALGLGTWSYVGLGLSLALILLNTTLGLGWVSRLVTPEFDKEGIENIEEQRKGDIQVLPLDDPSNLLR